jgi:hypothetical protein
MFLPSEEVVDLSNLNDDRNFISIDDKTVLIIEDDFICRSIILPLFK